MWQESWGWIEWRSKGDGVTKVLRLNWVKKPKRWYLSFWNSICPWVFNLFNLWHCRSTLLSASFRLFQEKPNLLPYLDKQTLTSIYPVSRILIRDCFLWMVQHWLLWLAQLTSVAVSHHPVWSLIWEYLNVLQLLLPIIPEQEWLGGHIEDEQIHWGLTSPTRTLAQGEAVHVSI